MIHFFNYKQNFNFIYIVDVHETTFLYQMISHVIYFPTFVIRVRSLKLSLVERVTTCNDIRIEICRCVLRATCKIYFLICKII